MVKFTGILWGSVCLAVAAGPALAGNPFKDSYGNWKWSHAYYEAHAGDPTGTRQVYKYGKLWPPVPRPVGDHQPCMQKFHDTHYWPHPYVCQDREAVNTFAQVQIQNGWIAATTLYEYHFDPLTQQLNSSGRAQLGWILTHVPEPFREVHVAVAASPDLSSQRMGNVEKTLAHLAGGNSSVAVIPRIADSIGRPATEVQYIFKSAQENQLPAAIEYQSANQDDASTGGG